MSWVVFAMTKPRGHMNEYQPPEPFYCKNHEAVWSPSLKRYVCDFCGHYMPDPDLTDLEGR